MTTDVTWSKARWARNGDVRVAWDEMVGSQGEAYNAEDMTDAAIAVLDDLGWSSTHVFGHSLGGAVAQRIGLRHPDRVRSVVSSAALPSDVSGLGWRATCASACSPSWPARSSPRAARATSPPA